MIFLVTVPPLLNCRVETALCLCKKNSIKTGIYKSKIDLMATIEESDTSRGDFQFEDVSFPIAFK
jgi:putative ribosome biogenesis GTPase RsgA